MVHFSRLEICGSCSTPGKFNRYKRDIDATARIGTSEPGQRVFTFTKSKLVLTSANMVFSSGLGSSIGSALACQD